MEHGFARDIIIAWELEGSFPNRMGKRTAERSSITALINTIPWMNFTEYRKQISYAGLQ